MPFNLQSPELAGVQLWSPHMIKVRFQVCFWLQEGSHVAMPRPLNSGTGGHWDARSTLILHSLQSIQPLVAAMQGCWVTQVLETTVPFSLKMPNNQRTSWKDAPKGHAWLSERYRGLRGAKLGSMTVSFKAKCHKHRVLQENTMSQAKRVENGMDWCWNNQGFHSPCCQLLFYFLYLFYLFIWLP